MSAPNDWLPLTWPDAQARAMTARANGSHYRISVWLPPGPAPAGGFPALFVLDANALFGTFVEGVKRSSRRADATGVGPAAIIGIAHDGDALFANALRRRDYTDGPPVGDAAPAKADIGEFGGAPALQAFLCDELVPDLLRTLPIDGARLSLFGHSLAGYFVLQTLAVRPDRFRHWIAISPSIWWNPAGLQARLAAALSDAPPARVFMAAGQWEDEVPPWQRAQPGYDQLVARRGERRMVASAQALAQQLGLWLAPDALRFQVFDDEDHASILMVAAQRTLRFISA